MEKQNEEEKTTDLELVEEPQQTLSLFGMGDPQKSIRLAKNVADSVAKIINDQKLFTEISKKKYVWCEGWTTMGALMGIFPHIIEVIDLSNPEIDLRRYQAICETRTLDGRKVSTAQSECSNDEKRWEKAEDYAIRSMAETRAVSKALRLPLGWIMKLANYQPVSAEEVDAEGTNNPVDPVMDGNGDVDEKATAMKKALGEKAEGETNKMYMIREIEYLLKKISMNEETFRKKVKDIDGWGNQSEMEIAEIRTVLWSFYRHGQTIKRIKVGEKNNDKKTD